MKKITNEEKERMLEDSGRIRGRVNPVFQFLLGLNIGESAFLGKDEWKQKTPPSSTIHSAGYIPRSVLFGTNFSVTKVDGGWVITRKEQRIVK